MDATQLAVMHEATIPEEYLDLMGHMNVMWYMHLFDRATWSFFAALGLDVAYFKASNNGTAALEQHIRYLSEVRLGQRVTLRCRALGRSAKRFHFMTFMLNEDSGALAATAELVGTHMDRAARKSSPLPKHATAAFDRVLAEHSRLDWAAPVCGVMAP